MNRFESLANELLLDIFEYLTSPEILRLFFGLNKRFNDLLRHYLQRNALDFRSVKKKDFDLICHHILPYLTIDVTRLHLSNGDDTPSQPTLFLSYGFQFDQFTSLFSLTLSSIHSIDLFQQILHHCPKLISLKLLDSEFDCNRTIAEQWMTQIWSLAELRSLTLDHVFTLTERFPLPQMTSSSLRSCSIQPNVIRLDHFFDLIQRMPHVEILNVKINSCSDIDIIFCPMNALKKLILQYEGSFNHFELLLLNFPNLLHLSVEIQYYGFDGDEWKRILSRTKINRFHLLMNCVYPICENHHEEINRIFQTFSTDFWLKDRQWFVRCDLRDEKRMFHIYTLPYDFLSFDATDIDQTMTTSPSSTSNFNDYSLVKRLVNNTKLSPCPFRFPSINELNVFCSKIDENLLTMIPRLDRLTSFDFYSLTLTDTSQDFSSLLNKAKHLSTLTMDFLTLEFLSSHHVNHPSAYRLNLMVNDGHFYGADCISMIQSLIGNRCEVLLINLEDHLIVLELLSQFPLLRSLTFQSQADRWDENEVTEHDELISWLQNHCPSTFSITRDDHATSAIRIWIG